MAGEAIAKRKKMIAHRLVLCTVGRFIFRLGTNLRG
jgi:hypothetical protein